MTMAKQVFGLTAVFIGLCYVGYEYLKQPRLELNPTSVEQQTPPLAPLQPVSKQDLDGEDAQEVPREIVKSIYDYDLKYRQKAQAAAENYIAPFSRDSVSRWRPVRIEPTNLLIGNYLEDGSVPKTFQISPFPDTTFIVSETKYTIMDFIETASWEGVIVGSDHGRVEITIVGGVDKPAFIIKIFNGPQIVSISPTESPDVYVAVEGNPFQPEATL